MRPMILAAYFVLWALLTHRQVADVWQSEAALWGAALRVSPRSPKVLVNYGHTREDAGNVDEAWIYYEAGRLEAAQRHKRFAGLMAEASEAKLLAAIGDDEHAHAHLIEVLTKEPTWEAARLADAVVQWRIAHRHQ